MLLSRFLFFVPLLLCCFVLQVNSNTVYQQPPFFQNWDNTSMITTNDDWSKVPGITGYYGLGLTDGSNGVDPATITYINVSVLIERVTANVNTTAITAGGVHEFQAPIQDPAVGLLGSSTVVAPFLLLHLNCSNFVNLTLSLRVRDMDNVDNAVQQFVVLYNLPDTNATLFTPVNGTKISDATIASAYKDNNLTVFLPNSTWLKSKVRLAFITTNAAGVDETLGIDDIKVTGISIASPSPTPSITPSVSPSASPSAAASPSASGIPSAAPSTSTASTPSISPSTSSFPTPSASSAPSMSSTPSISPSTSSFPTPSASSSPSMSSTPSISPSTSSFPTPSTSASGSPSVSPSTSSFPSPAVSLVPSPSTSNMPSSSPSTSHNPPSSSPSHSSPSASPSSEASPIPSPSPSSIPSETPSPSSAITPSPSTSASSTPIIFPSSSPVATPDSPSSSEGDNSSTLIIVGAVVGGVILLAAIGGAVAFFALRNKRTKGPIYLEEDL